ncbi:MAG: DUF2865 domain-containing protein, partial [Salaquimonas sp.]
MAKTAGNKLIFSSAPIRLAAGIILSLALTAFSSFDIAFAQQSATCRSLQAQLAAVETGRGIRNNARYQKFDRAAQQQQAQITKTEQAARRNGCQLLRTNICVRINDSLIKMNNNLVSLIAGRNKAGGVETNRGDRAKILRALKQNNCYANTQSASAEPQPTGRKTLLEQIFGTKTYTNDGASSEITNPNDGRNFGTYRTLCVRTCDGYYFPISFSTTQKRFEEDAGQCQQMCPGAETALFYHPMPNGDAETALSYR